MSFPAPNWDNRPGPTLWDRISEAVGHTNEVNVYHCEKLIHTDLGQVQTILAASNKSTCRYFWRRWMGSVNQKEDGSHPGWSIVSSFTHRFDDGINTKLLLLALRVNKPDIAHQLISMGTRLAGWDESGQSRIGPAQRLFYGRSLSRPDACHLGQMMLDRGAIKNFDPGAIAYKELVQLFLEHAPSPKDVQAWRAFDTCPYKIVQYQCRKGSETDKENIPLFLAAGYPADHVDLLARSIMAGRNDIAHCLLDWEGFEPNTTADPGSNPGPAPDRISPSTFWYAIVDFWLSSYAAGLVNENHPAKWSLHWPDEKLFSRLMDISALDMAAINPKTEESALTLCEGGSHGCPLLHDVARWKRSRLLKVSGQRVACASVQPAL